MACSGKSKIYRRTTKGTETSGNSVPFDPCWRCVCGWCYIVEYYFYQHLSFAWSAFSASPIPVYIPAFLFVYCFISCRVIFEIKKSGYKIKKILSALFINTLFIFYLLYAFGPFTHPFQDASVIAVDKNNTLYIFDEIENEIVQINSDKNVYKRYRVPNLDKFVDYGSCPCVTNDGICIFAASKKRIVTYDTNTGSKNRWQPGDIAHILDICLDENEDIVVFGCDEDKVRWAQWYELDGTLIRKALLDEQLPCDAQLCAVVSEYLFFINRDKLVQVLDKDGQQISSWKLPGVSPVPYDCLWYYHISASDKDENLYFLTAERGPILKCDLDGNELGKFTLDISNQDDAISTITSGPSKDIFVSDILEDTVRQYDSNGNLRFTHGRFQWLHYRAFLRNLFSG